MRMSRYIAIYEPLYCMANPELAEEFVVGARCCSEGFCATVRFVGEVPPTKGLIWCGCASNRDHKLGVDILSFRSVDRSGVG